MDAPDLQPFLAEAAPLIDATVAKTGRPRQEYVDYLVREPDEGVAWSTALHARLESLAAGPLSPGVARELSRMVPAKPDGRSDAA